MQILLERESRKFFELLVLEEGAWLLDMEKKRIYKFEEKPLSDQI